MPSRKTTKAAAAAKLPPITKQLIDQFVSGPMSVEVVQNTSMAFKNTLLGSALGAELSHHRGTVPAIPALQDSANHRSGSTSKMVLAGNGRLRSDVPRDRAGSFEPLLISKHERRFTGFDDKIVPRTPLG